MGQYCPAFERVASSQAQQSTRGHHAGKLSLMHEFSFQVQWFVVVVVSIGISLPLAGNSSPFAWLWVGKSWVRPVPGKASLLHCQSLYLRRRRRRSRRRRNRLDGLEQFAHCREANLQIMYQSAWFCPSWNIAIVSSIAVSAWFCPRWIIAIVSANPVSICLFPSKLDYCSSLFKCCICLILPKLHYCNCLCKSCISLPDSVQVGLLQ